MWGRYQRLDEEIVTLQADDDSKAYYKAKGFIYIGPTEAPGVEAKPARAVFSAEPKKRDK